MKKAGEDVFYICLDNSILDKVQEGMGEAHIIQRRVDDKIHQSKLGILGLTQAQTGKFSS